MQRFHTCALLFKIYMRKKKKKEKEKKKNKIEIFTFGFLTIGETLADLQ